MSTWPLRFVHASDFHLEQSPHGLSDVPDHLREMLLEAPYQAAGNVFDTAIVEEVDCVLLAGDIVNAKLAGPRALVFLAEQFERLAESGIEIYWAGGRVDPPRTIRAATDWPANVHLFAAGDTEEFVHHRDGQPIAHIVGCARGRSKNIPISKLQPPPTDRFSIGVAHGQLTHAAVEQQQVAYLAAGGHHGQRSFGAGRRVAEYPGSPQGRSPRETGRHGCHLVEVDPTNRPHTRFVATDVFRWTTEPVVVDDSTSSVKLEQQMTDRLHQLVDELVNEAEGIPQLITWNVTGHGPLLRELRSGDIGEPLLATLRQSFGHLNPALWSVSIKVESTAATLPREWSEQDTILGDFLRLTERHITDPDLPMNLEALVSEHHLAGSLEKAVCFPTSAVRERVLKDAALLGADLLGADLVCGSPSGGHSIQTSSAE